MLSHPNALPGARFLRALTATALLATLWSCAIPESVRSVQRLPATPAAPTGQVTSAGAMTPRALGGIELVNIRGIAVDDAMRSQITGALNSALQRERVFGSDPESPYLLRAVVTRLGETGGGLFGGDAVQRFVVQYALFDHAGTRVYQRRLTSESKGSDPALVIQDNARQLAGQLRQYFALSGTQKASPASAGAPAPVAATPAASTLRPARTEAPSPAATRPVLAPGRSTSPTQTGRPDRRNVSVPAVEIESLSGNGISFGSYHALIIGNDRYRHLKPLRNAAKDARRLDSILRSHYGFKTTVLVDATRHDILAALGRLRRSLGKKDNLLIYYAGHGTLDERADEGYWLPVDAHRDNPTNWISNIAITTEIRAIRAKHVLIVADSCFAGKLTRGIKPRLAARGYLRRMANRTSRTALTSGGLEPVLDGGTGSGHSVFASALFDALLTNTGVVDTAQIIGFVRHRVYLEADQLPEYGDIRRAGHGGGDFLFVRKR